MSSLSRARRVVVAAVLVAATMAACSDKESPTGLTPPGSTITPVAQAYLDTALAFMEQYYYFADTVNWSIKRSRATDRAGAAQTRKDVYPAIIQA